MAHIYILEDDIDAAEVYAMALESAGHEVVESRASFATTPRSRKTPPDVMILDERLGALSGTSFIPKIRKAFPSVRILLLTADPDAVREATERGADAAHEKPITLAKLVSEVVRLTTD